MLFIVDVLPDLAALSVCPILAVLSVCPVLAVLSGCPFQAVRTKKKKNKAFDRELIFYKYNAETVSENY
jgi:hypothetical protein